MLDKSVVVVVVVFVVGECKPVGYPDGFPPKSKERRQSARHERTRPRKMKARGGGAGEKGSSVDS